MPNIAKQWQPFEQLSAPALYEILRFRQSIFVVEQSSPYADLDDCDQRAWHLSLRVQRQLTGYLRLMPPTVVEASVRIGRVAVAAHLRRHGLGRQLVEEALRFCRELSPERPIVLAAQLPLVSFYKTFGFAVTSAPYDDFGVAHVEMSIQSGAAPQG